MKIFLFVCFLTGKIKAGCMFMPGKPVCFSSCVTAELMLMLHICNVDKMPKMDVLITRKPYLTTLQITVQPKSAVICKKQTVFSSLGNKVLASAGILLFSPHCENAAVDLVLAFCCCCCCSSCLHEQFKFHRYCDTKELLATVL